MERTAATLATLGIRMPPHRITLLAVATIAIPLSLKAAESCGSAYFVRGGQTFQVTRSNGSFGVAPVSIPTAVRPVETSECTLSLPWVFGDGSIGVLRATRVGHSTRFELSEISFDGSFPSTVVARGELDVTTTFDIHRASRTRTLIREGGLLRSTESEPFISAGDYVIASAANSSFVAFAEPKALSFWRIAPDRGSAQRMWRRRFTAWVRDVAVVGQRVAVVVADASRKETLLLMDGPRTVQALELDAKEFRFAIYPDGAVLWSPESSYAIRLANETPTRLQWARSRPAAVLPAASVREAAAFDERGLNIGSVMSPVEMSKKTGSRAKVVALGFVWSVLVALAAVFLLRLASRNAVHR
jgi:hypothetical protein